MMKTLNDYLNDPGIVNEPMPLREIHAIRLMIWDEIKDMTTDEINAYFARESAEAKKLMERPAKEQAREESRE